MAFSQGNVTPNWNDFDLIGDINMAQQLDVPAGTRILRAAVRIMKIEVSVGTVFVKIAMGPSPNDAMVKATSQSVNIDDLPSFGSLPSDGDPIPWAMTTFNFSPAPLVTNNTKVWLLVEKNLTSGDIPVVRAVFDTEEDYDFHAWTTLNGEGNYRDDESERDIEHNIFFQTQGLHTSNVGFRFPYQEWT